MAGICGTVRIWCKSVECQSVSQFGISSMRALTASRTGNPYDFKRCGLIQSHGITETEFGQVVLWMTVAGKCLPYVELESQPTHGSTLPLPQQLDAVARLLWPITQCHCMIQIHLSATP